MRRILGWAGLALAVLVGAVTYSELGLSDGDVPAWLSWFWRSGGQDDSLFRAMDSANPTSGLNYSTAATFCSGPEFTAARSGATNGFCYSATGDHWESSASYALSAVGSPTTVSRRVCPNGSDCGLMTGLKTVAASSQWLKTSNVATPSGSFSFFWLGRHDSATATQEIVSQWGVTGTNPSVAAEFAGSDGSLPTFYVSKGVGFTTTLASPTSVPRGSVSLVIGTYQYVGDGTSVMKLYVDGTLVNTAATAVGPPNALTIPIGVGGLVGAGSGASFLDGQTYTAGRLDGIVLSATDVTTLTSALLPQATGAKGTRGETITTTRASVATCTAPADGDGDGANDVSVLPNNRPCITCLGGACGVWTEPSGVETALQVQDQSNASWTKTNMTCTATALSINGGTASTCTATAANATVLQALTLAAASRPTTVDIKRRTGTGNIDITRDNGTTWTTLGATQCVSDTTGAAQALNSSTWSRCILTSSVLNPTIGLRIVTSGDAIDIDYFNDTDGSGAPTLMTSRIPATTATVTRSGVLPGQFAKPAGFSDTEGCARLTITPIWTGANPLANNLYWLHAGATTAAPILVRGSTGSVNWAAFDGTNSATTGAGYAASTPKTLRVTWSASANALVVQNVTDGNSNTSAAFSSLGSASTFTIGAAAGNSLQPIGGIVSNLVVGNSASGCLR